MTKKPTSPHKSKPTYLKASDFILIPLGILTGYCLYFFLAHISVIPRTIADPLSIPFSLPLLALIIAIFGAIYTYKELKRNEVSKYARGVAYLFSALTVWAALILIINISADASGAECTGIMGGKIPCSTSNLFHLALWYLNPLSLIAWGILSITASIGLLKEPKHKTN